MYTNNISLEEAKKTLSTYRSMTSLLENAIRTIEKGRECVENEDKVREQAQEISSLKNELKCSKYRENRRDQMEEFLLSNAGFSRCKECGGEGGWDNGEGDGEECEKCKGVGFVSKVAMEKTNTSKPN